jgi:PBP1b-binding outer membrane lipoprotein LpoB
MDDLIVIILTLVIILAGVIGQFKKKEQVNNTAGEATPRDEEDLWSLPGEEIDEKYHPQEIISGDKIPELKTELSVKPQKFIKKKSIFEDDLTKQGIGLESGESASKNKFPLRKAVIYSEILNRKYT